MALVDGGRCVHAADVRGVRVLDERATDELLAFFALWSDSWFDVRTLATGLVRGVRWCATCACVLDDDADDAAHAARASCRVELAAVAGVHCVSRSLRVGALGNVFTRATARRRGLARRVAAAVCQALLRGDDAVDTLGLNVVATNAAAVRLYEQLGFAVITRFGEWAVDRRRRAVDAADNNVVVDHADER